MPRLNLTHKFKAIQTTVDDFKFSSKKEAAYYNTLKCKKNLGEILFFLRQVPFDLPGKIKYFLDFMVFYTNGDIEFIEVKGMPQRVGINKVKQVEEIYNIDIKIV